jgi:uncharacterized membrane protein YfhO
VYLNLDYINLGKTYTGGIMTYDDYDPSMSAEITDKVICHPEDYEEIKTLLGAEDVQCYSAWAEGNHVSAGLKATQNGFAVLSVPYDKGWTVMNNSVPVKTYCVNGGMTGIAVTPGENDIQMWFAPRGLKIGELFTIAGIILCIAVVILNRSHNKK